MLRKGIMTGLRAMRRNLFGKRAIVLVGLIIFMSVSSRAQNFSSGSTGVDGALNLTTGSCQRQVQLPESGVLNYTTITIPINCGLSFRPNFRNTPTILLAQGDVTIAGVISVDASGQVPGPGGFYGGAINQNGFGPGGGTSGFVEGRWVGSLSLVPIIGGSGGFGQGGFPGGGGGGAITIASSTSIVVSGFVGAIGSNAGNSHGSGGAIRLVANSIAVPSHNAFGTNFQATGGGLGVVRLEAPSGSLVYNGASNPVPILSTTINPQIVSDSTVPSLGITSIGGFPVSFTAGRPDSVDLILPNQIVDPVNVVVQAHNIPVGTQVNLNISGLSSGTFSPGTLSGTEAASSTTIAVSGLSRTGATYLIAFADFTLPASAMNFNRKGPDQIAKVRVVAKPGTDSRLVFLRKNGTEIELTKVPKAIQQRFGLN